jgi:hypothetical protein
MKRSRTQITIERLDGVRTDGSTHRLVAVFSRYVRIEQMMVIEIHSKNGRSTRLRPLETLVRNLAAVKGVSHIKPEEAVALGLALGRLMWEGGAPDLEELWITTDDPLIAGLPWALASTESSDSLIAQHIPVVVQVGASLESAGLPIRPKLLCLAPEYEGEKATGWAAHLKALKDKMDGLCSIITFHPAGEADISRALADNAPDIVYYFGHGEVNGAGIFRLDLGNSEVTAERLSSILSGSLSDGRPIYENVALLYLNCCWGGVSTAYGGPTMLAKLVPAFISNRASAINDVAQRQAIAILTEILGNGIAPHEAVRNAVHAELTRSGAAAEVENEVDEPWWLVPTIFARYGAWERQRPRQLDRIFSFEETLEIDRLDHCELLGESLKRGHADIHRPRVLMTVWHGESDDGLHSLSERLCFQILDGFRACHLAVREVGWPTQLPELSRQSERERVIREAITIAICGPGAANGAVGRRARDLLRPAGGVAVLRQAQIDEGVVPAGKRSQLKDILLAYAAVLHRDIVPVLDAPPPVFLVAMVRIAGSDADINDAIERAQADNWTRVEIIPMPSLDPVRDRDIEIFLRRLQLDRQDVWRQQKQITLKILKAHNGRYEPTRKLLANIEDFI